MDFRSSEDIITDNLLLLYIISKSTNLGRTKLQKLVYLVECKFGNKNIKTFNYNFKRWHHGPFTKEIFEDSESLVENHIIFDQDTKVSKRGQIILEQSKDVFEENKQIINEIDELINKYDKLELDELINAVYNSKVKINGEAVRVEDVPMGTPLKTKVAEDKAVDKIDINEKWFETLDILFDTEFNDSLNKASAEAKTDHSYSYNEVFLDV